ncbi:MAG: hypothetical protein KatS3mg105_2281 [Gemmatales bacterium]|nr:MAG: hypothetical protein KatS3mg105_2281 [Gemmatales bacterium]
MVIGSLRVRLRVRDARSLKDKRRVVRSIKDRLRNGYNISIAEVDAQDKYQLAVLGIALVADEAYFVRTTLEKIVENLRHHPVAELIDHELEVGAVYE